MSNDLWKCLIVLICLSLSPALQAQDTAEPAPGQQGAEASSDEAPPAEEELDADEAWSRPADDAAFKPTETLTADSEIAFPADI